jgi:signal transduction histidine kinase
MLTAVFERFWQVGRDDQRGLGLGLYISKCIVEAHSGRIWAESKEGEGSTFSFTMPGVAD